MKILFLVRHYMYVRYFDAVVVELARRGHDIHISADKWELTGGQRLVEDLSAAHPNITYGWTPGRAHGPWNELAKALRLSIDYLRFLDARYAGAPHMRGRAAERASRAVRFWLRLPGFSSDAGRRRVGGVLRWLDRAVPRSRWLDRFVREQDADVVLITPLIELGSPQIDHLISTRATRARSMLCVGSWDHLSSKSLIREPLPDAVTVWNATQQREAIDLHGVPPERVVVTGAQCFDQWFDRQPSRPRAAFLARVGLPADRPFLLYVCSSLFRGTMSEPRFVEEWIRHIRSAADPVLREMPILVRPHPQRMEEWQHVDLTGFKDVAFYGSHPIDGESRSDYFDSLHYSHAVVGLNTSAFIEAAIAGRPVFTVLLPQMSAANQEGTLHFHYLLDEQNGLLHVARSIEAHLDQLAAAARESHAPDPRSRRFVETFVRPFGAGEAATPRFVAAVEALGARGPAEPAVASGAGVWLARAALAPWLATVGARLGAVFLVRRLRGKWLKDARALVRARLSRTKRWMLVRLGVVEPLPGPGGSLMPKIGRAGDPAKGALLARIPEAIAVREEIHALGRTSNPIIVGPWLTEAGFELLYWIPFLAWARAYGNLDPARLHVVSRGGVAGWYRRIGAHYHDLFALYPPDEFRARNDERVAAQGGRFKHADVTPFDREAADRIARAHGIGKYRLLHPSLMYRLFSLYWRQLAPIALVERFTSYERLPAAGPGELARQLPREYVAVKFYANGALPDTPENRAFVAGVVAELAQATDVVLLNTAWRFDDHADLPVSARGRVHAIDHLMTPETNLDVQTRVIAGARALVGTYGGFSYLGPLVGTSTVAFYSHPTGFRFDHLDVARRVFAGIGGASFIPLDVKDAAVLRQMTHVSLAL
ncbi:MAG: hypothetical protein HY824_05130 [Acidobacteria bacterium]|nr:hypothetical protein [Acidobacteriota bacterium]